MSEATITDRILVQRADSRWRTNMPASLPGRTGAIVSFVGKVRDFNQGRGEGLALEHYPGMTEKALAISWPRPVAAGRCRSVPSFTNRRAAARGSDCAGGGEQRPPRRSLWRPATSSWIS